MIYLNRIFNLIWWLLRHIFKIVLYIGISVVCIIQICAIMLLFPPVLFLQLIEILFVPAIYYIIKGKKYYDTYECITNVYCDFIAIRQIVFRKDKYVEANKKYYEYDPDFYERLYNKLNDKKITL